MADHNKSSSSAEEGIIETGDDFDPFSGVIEYVDEHVDTALKAPPENQWYHGRLDRNTAEDRLRVAGLPGSYLIRESDRKPGSYVLSYLGQTGFNHFRITAMCGDYYIGGRQYNSLSDLIGYYTSCSYLLKDEQLQHPVAPPEPVDDRRKVKAILPYRGMQERDELSFDKNDIFLVHNELGDGWLWVTSQRTGDEGIVFEDLVEDLNGNIDPVEALPYFHPNISKDSAAEKLGNAGHCSFLVRPSDNSPGNYSLFFLCNRKVMRFRIEKQGRQFLMGGRYFDTMEAIVQRYKKEQILQGYNLTTPVIRDICEVDGDKGLSSPFDYNRSNAIYATIRNTSGPTLVKARNDKIVMKGYLNKKNKGQWLHHTGQRTKKWKNLYFVLNGTEQQLYYFENEKRSKPKGLIDLIYSSLYPVHDSFFGRPNCFQLVMNAMNNYSVYYLCAESSDLAQEWLSILKLHCVNTICKKHQSLSAALKEQRSLTIQVCDAHRLPSRHLPHPYCIVSLNNVKVCRTLVAEGADPVWSEEFILDDIPADIESISASIFNHAKRTKDAEILYITIQLNAIESGKMHDEWYPLNAVSPTMRGDVGTLRIQLRYLHEIIMPVEEYTSLKQLLLDDSYENVITLSECCDNDRVRLAKALLRIFRQERQEANLLKVINDTEINKEEFTTTLFRATSLATTLMDQYMKMTATPFVHAALKSTVLKIVDGKHSCELNPELCENQADVEANRDHFLSLLNEVAESMFKSTENCPCVLRYICGSLQRSVIQKWPQDDMVKTRVVSGFIFLRLLCPALLDPKSFNLLSETPSEMAQRTLKLVAKSLQNLANLVEVKETFMKVVNPFIKGNKQRMIMFLDELSNVADCPKERDRITGDMARDMATVHQICASWLDDLKKLAEKQPSSSVKQLTVITEMLTSHKRHYMGENT